MMKNSLYNIVPTLLVTAITAKGFYLPGVAPTDYNKGDLVPVLANVLTPDNPDRISSIISYDYYRPEFHFCPPEGGPKHVQESLGSIVFGDRIFTTPFELKMGIDEDCKLLCTSLFGAMDSRFVNRRIRQSYKNNFLIDGLPAATVLTNPETNTEIFYIGTDLGYIEKDGNPYFNNHFEFYIDYHITREGKYRVVGVVIEPSSRNIAVEEAEKAGYYKNPDCSALDSPIHLDRERSIAVHFTYSVHWRESETAWATRWDNYLKIYGSRIHWFSLVNCLIIVFFLTSMVGIVLIKTLRKDIHRYNELDLAADDVQDESGWKLVHGDVFRPPSKPLLLSVLIGSGAQLFFMASATVFFALLGLLSPSNRGSLTTVMILFFTVFSFVSGYVSARAYNSLCPDGNWRHVVILSPTLVPVFFFGSFVILNFFLISAHASGAAPFGTMLALFAIWFAVSIPLSAVGSYFGFRTPAFTPPTRTNQIPRQIPQQPVYLQKVPSILLAGLLPFAAMFVEQYFILNSIWFHHIYYMFGFLFASFVLVSLSTATITILIIYFMLCSENYNWQWRAFLCGGSSAIYVWLHAILFWISKFSGSGVVSSVMYLGYSFVISVLVFIISGFIGEIAAFWFVRRIYASIKID